MKYTSVILSKRRNPEINNERFNNIRFFKYYELDKNNKIPNYFISFTSSMSSKKEKNRPVFTDSKIGINPNSEYDTPIGVYTYTVNDIYKDFLKKNIPYASEQPYIIILKLNTKKVLHLKYYSSSRNQKDWIKLKSIFDKNIDKVKTNIVKLKKYLVNRRQSIEEIKAEPNFNTVLEMSKVFGKSLAERNRSLNHIYRYQFWWATRLVALLLNGVNDTNTAMWNKILRSIGYEVIIDPGYGIIHPNEPKQAVFLTPNSYKRIDSIKNDNFNFIVDEDNPININKLPNNFVSNGSLNLRNKHIRQLPINLTVNGDLNLSNSTIRFLPSGLSVAGKINLSGTKIKTIPEDIKCQKLNLVNTQLDSIPSKLNCEQVQIANSNVINTDGGWNVLQNLNGCIVTKNFNFSKNKVSFPDNFTINGSVSYEDSNVFLPRNLKINGELKLVRCSVNMSSGIKVDKLILDKTLVTKINDIKFNDINISGSNVVVQSGKLTRLEDVKEYYGDIDLTRSPYIILSDNLIVHGNLILDESKITKLPDGLDVRGKLSLNKVRNLSYIGKDIKYKEISLKSRGVIFFQDKLMLVKDLENKTIQGSFDLSNSNIDTLPNNMTITGDLNLQGSKISILPSITVKGSLDLSESKIKKLPDNLKIGKDLNLNNTSNLSYLSNNIEVGGNLLLEAHMLQELPDNLKVYGNLDLTFTSFRSIPKNLFVKGKLTLRYHNIPENYVAEGSLEIQKSDDDLPNGLYIKKDLILVNCEFEKLPEDLFVDGSIKIINCDIKKIPENLLDKIIYE